MSGTSGLAWRAFAGRYAIALVVAIAFTATGVAAVDREIDHRVQDIERVRVTVATPPSQGANYLLLGSDTRGFVEHPDDVEAFGSAEQERDTNSDTLMIAHIEPGAQRAVVVSFPRDLKVEVPGGEGATAKINSFFGSGGPQAVVDMLKWNFDVDVHHYVEVDFESFRQAVNAIGTVNVWFDHPTRDDFTGLGQSAGCQALDGDEALHYVRSRSMEQLIDGEWQLVGQDAPDLHRIERQQDFIRKLLGLAISKSLGNPFVALDIADNTLEHMKLDREVGRGEVNELIKAFRSVDVNDPNAVLFETIPTTVDPANPASTLVLTDGAPEMIDQIRTFGAQPAPAVAATPGEVNVRVVEGVPEVDVNRTTSVGEELARSGFVATEGAPVQRKGQGRFFTEIRYAPSQIAAAKLLSAYVPDAGLVLDPTLGERLELVLGVTFQQLVVPATTAPVTPTATVPSTAPAPVTTVDPRVAACG
jgi:LCP family protein required for cell wall assembly